VPDAMAADVAVAAMTQQYADWSRQVFYVVAAAVGLIALTAVAGICCPRRVPRVALIVPFVLGIWMLGHFERVREFIRKPYVIADYMYSNGVRVQDVPLYQKEGILTYAEFAAVREVTDDNKLVAGREVFMLSCSRCHTTNGMNGLVQRFRNLYGDGPWDPEQLANFVRGVHISRPYMPPFPGNEPELDALVTYVRHLHKDGRPPAGVSQSVKSQSSIVASASP
jgi:mono/diheme cytochrome c family protein